jgi:hypothetical protein
VEDGGLGMSLILGFIDALKEKILAVNQAFAKAFAFFAAKGSVAAGNGTRSEIKSWFDFFINVFKQVWEKGASPRFASNHVLAVAAFGFKRAKRLAVGSREREEEEKAHLKKVVFTPRK